MCIFLLHELRQRLRQEADFSVTPYAARRAGTKAHMYTGLREEAEIYIRKSYWSINGCKSASSGGYILCVTSYPARLAAYGVTEKSAS